MIMPKLPSLASTVDGKRIEKLSDFKGELRNLWRDGTPEKASKKGGHVEGAEFVPVRQAAQWFAYHYPMVKDSVQRVNNWLARKVLTTYYANPEKTRVLVSMAELAALEIREDGELIPPKRERYNTQPKNIAYELGLPVPAVREAISSGKVIAHERAGKMVYYHKDFKALFGLE